MIELELEDGDQALVYINPKYVCSIVGTAKSKRSVIRMVSGNDYTVKCSAEDAIQILCKIALPPGTK